MSAGYPRLLLKCDPRALDRWCRALARELPDARVDPWPGAAEPESADYALLWQPEDSLLARLAGVRAIFSLGAGVDHLLGKPSLPPMVPVVRLVDPGLTEGMTHYLVYQVLRIHRRMAVYERQQSDSLWREQAQRPAARCRIGVLGMGVLGSAAATTLAGLGFTVAGWRRQARSDSALPAYSGRDGLEQILASSDILILLLPLTADTRGLIDATALARIKPGSWLINVGRGGLVDEPALLAALDRGQLGGACLDVFAEEPLPPGHVFWQHPRVAVTPHVASLTAPDSAAAVIAGQIRRHLDGGELVDCVDRRRGY